jgi:hypothetical protein
MKPISIVLLFCGLSSAYTEGTVLVLSTGARTLTVTNSGPLGGSQAVTIPTSANQKAKIWLSEAGFPERRSEQSCADPCSILINMERGQVKYWYEIADSNGNPLSPRMLSSKLKLKFIQAPTISSPFIVPAAVHGFEGYTTAPMQFNVPSGTDVSNLRVWLYGFNLRQNDAAVIINGATEHVIGTTPITKFDSNGSTCTAGTSVPHGLSTSDVADFEGFTAVISNTTAVSSRPFNGLHTIASVPNATTFTVACSLDAGDWNPDIGGNFIVGQQNGMTVSKKTHYVNEKRWHMGIDSIHEDVELAVPLGASEITANANNTIALRFNGIADSTVHGWWALAFNIIQPDIEITQIVVTNLNAVATTAGAHGYNAGDTILIRDAPGPRWRFNGTRVITAKTPTTFTFLWGSDLSGETPGVAPYTTANGTYVVPTTKDAYIAPAPHMHAARCLIPKSSFQQLDPSTYTSTGDATDGRIFWETAVLQDRNNYFPNHATLATCADCHTKSGYDLKYFGWPPYVIEVAAIGRGLTETQAKDISAFILSNSAATPAKGRPWNPPYQPGCSIDSLAISNWSAGCGLEWVTTYDEDTKEWLVPGGSYAQWAPAAGGVNTREIPINMPLTHWMQWLPSIHPKDFFNLFLGGLDFTANDMWTRYQTYLSTQVAGDFATYKANSFFQLVAGVPVTGSPGDLFTPRFAFAAAYSIPYLPGGSTDAAGYYFPSEYLPGFSSLTIQWVTSRIWEMMNVFHLQHFCADAYNDIYGAQDARASAPYARCWYTEYPFNTGPHKAIGGGHQGFMNGDFRGDHNFNRFTDQWYHLQAVVGPGNRRASNNFELDWPYYYAFISSNCNVRPCEYRHVIPMAFEVANEIGWPALTGNTSIYGGAGLFAPMTAVNPRFDLGRGYVDLFTPETTIAEHVNQLLQQTIYLSTAFSVTEWRNWITLNEGAECLSATPNALSAYLASGCKMDGVGLLLAYASFYNLSASGITTVVNWANSVTTSGYDFRNMANLTCTMDTSIHPPRVKCPPWN